MNTPDDEALDNKKNYKLKDANDNNGIVPDDDDALQKVNPAAAEELTPDHDPHHVAKDHKQYDSALTVDDK